MVVASTEGHEKSKDNHLGYVSDALLLLRTCFLIVAELAFLKNGNFDFLGLQTFYP